MSDIQEDLSPRERRAVRTREAILDAAREIISERGAYSLSLREVARRIDYSPAGLYEYFGSKDELIAAVLEDGFTRFGRYLLSVPQELEARAYLRELGLAYIRFAQQNPEHFMLIFNSPNICELPSEEDFVHQGTFNTLTTGIQRCIEAGHISAEHDLKDLVYGAWALVHGMATLLVTQVSQIDRNWEQTSTKLMRNWLDGLT